MVYSLGQVHTKTCNYQAKSKNVWRKYVANLVFLKIARCLQASQMQEHERQEKIHQEMMTIQIKYQREIDRLEKEIKAMKKQILLRQERNLGGKKQRKIKVSIFETLPIRITIHVFLLLEISD